MVLQIPGGAPLTEQKLSRLFWLLLEDDTEDAPWMVLGSLQVDATFGLYQSLRHFAEVNQRPWCVACMLPIRFSPPVAAEKKQVAPDIFVAFVPDRPRASFDADTEGGFPPFVLEVVSPSSSDRDHITKRGVYEEMQAREYVLFTPYADRPAILSGYRRDAAGGFEEWRTDDRGRLWSEVLGLFLVVEGRTVRAETREGELIPTLKEAVANTQREASARREADLEVERLRRENEELRRQVKGE